MRLAGPFGYIPITRPPPFSILRQIAYQEGTALLGPTIDTEGWFRTESVKVQVKVFNTRTVKVGCTVRLLLGLQNRSLLSHSLAIPGQAGEFAALEHHIHGLILSTVSSFLIQGAL